jgi:hypothetical protein
MGGCMGPDDQATGQDPSAGSAARPRGGCLGKGAMFGAFGGAALLAGRLVPRFLGAACPPCRRTGMRKMEPSGSEPLRTASTKPMAERARARRTEPLGRSPWEGGPTICWIGAATRWRAWSPCKRGVLRPLCAAGMRRATRIKQGIGPPGHTLCPRAHRRTMRGLAAVPGNRAAAACGPARHPAPPAPGARAPHHDRTAQAAGCSSSSSGSGSAASGAPRRWQASRGQPWALPHAAHGAWRMAHGGTVDHHGGAEWPRRGRSTPRTMPIMHAPTRRPSMHASCPHRLGGVRTWRAAPRRGHRCPPLSRRRFPSAAQRASRWGAWPIWGAWQRGALLAWCKASSGTHWVGGMAGGCSNGRGARRGALGERPGGVAGPIGWGAWQGDARMAWSEAWCARRASRWAKPSKLHGSKPRWADYGSSTTAQRYQHNHPPPIVTFTTAHGPPHVRPAGCMRRSSSPSSRPRRTGWGPRPPPPRARRRASRAALGAGCRTT